MSDERKAAELKPGSDAAIAAGCSCPVLDNGHGRGYMGVSGIYVYSGDCPLHKHVLDQDFVNDPKPYTPTPEAS